MTTTNQKKGTLFLTGPILRLILAVLLCSLLASPLQLKAYASTEQSEAAAAPADPAPADAAPGDPVPADPAPAEAVLGDPVPADPAPAEAAPEDPVPADPAPAEAAPGDPAPTDPTPAEAAPGDPAPADPTPAEAAPEDPVPADPAPTDPAPENPEPAEPDSQPPVPESGLVTAQNPALQAAGGDATEGGDTTDYVTGAGDVQDETYSLPEGSAYLYEVGKVTIYKNDASQGSAIQQGLESALTYAKGLYGGENPAAVNRTATIIVSEGTYEGGISLGTQEEGNTLYQLFQDLVGIQSSYQGPDDHKLTIRIVSEDSIQKDADGNYLKDEQGNLSFHADASGNAQLEGGIDILSAKMDLEILLAGIYLSTRGLVNIDGADSVTILGTQKDDYLTLNVTNTGSEVYVDTGGGDDVVKITGTSEPNIQVTMEKITAIDEAIVRQVADLTGDSFLTDAMDVVTRDALTKLKQELHAQAQSVIHSQTCYTVRTGSGDDTLTLDVADGTSLESQQWQGTAGLLVDFTVSVDTDPVQVNVDTGEGSDRITLRSSQSQSHCFPLLNAAAQYVKANRTPTDSRITVNAGAGDDVITVDNSLAFASEGQTLVDIQGQTGYDRLHLTGTLDPLTANPIEAIPDIQSDKVEFVIHAETYAAKPATLVNPDYTSLGLAYRTLYYLVTRTVEAFTDLLENKKTVYIDSSTQNLEAQPYTNYVVKPENRPVTFTTDDHFINLDSSNTFLSNILIRDKSDLLDFNTGYRQVTIDYLYAPNFNVIVDSEGIDVRGAVTGRNVLLQIYAEDEAVVELETDIGIEIPTDLIDPETQTPNPYIEATAQFGLYEAESEVYIRIWKTGSITASQAVDLMASLYLHHALTPELLTNAVGLELNPVTVKIGKSHVEIYGSITAGGSVHATSDVDITVDATNGELTRRVIPMAIGFVSGWSKVTVGEFAKIQAGRLENLTRDAGIRLTADSAIKILAHAGPGWLKFNVSLAAVLFETVALVTDHARLTATGDVRVWARNHLVTGVSSQGKPGNVFNVKPQTGIFLTGTFADVLTDARVTGNAQLKSENGSVDVLAIFRMSNTTVAVSIPTQTESLAGQFTISRAIPFFMTLLGLQGKTTALEQLINRLATEKLTDILYTALGSMNTGTATAQIMGVLALAWLDTRSNAIIDTTEEVSADQNLRVLAMNEIRSEVRSDASLYRTASILPGFPSVTWEAIAKASIGTAIGLSVINQKADAAIVRGRIHTRGLDVEALLGDSASSLVVKSGHLPEDQRAKFGLAGAVAVHLVTAENHALVGSGAAYTLRPNGHVLVLADGSGSYITAGDASGKRVRWQLDMGAVKVPFEANYTGSPGFVAVGSGVAVDIIGIDSRAQIADGVSFDQKSDQSASLTVRADFTGTHRIEAAAGAEGGVSVIPVVALSLGGVKTTAYLGTGSRLILSGDAAVESRMEMIRNMVSDAEAAGVKAGMGAAVAIYLVDDSSEATVNRSLEAANLLLHSSAISRVTQEVRASARGMLPPSGLGQYAGGFEENTLKQEDLEKYILENTVNKSVAQGEGGIDTMIRDLTSRLMGVAGYTPTPLPQFSPANLQKLTANPPSASTSEGVIQAAAAVAVNLQDNRSEARLGDGLSIVTLGDVIVISQQDTDATVSAKGTAVKDKAGVAAAVALNDVAYINRAVVGASTLSAGGNIRLEANIVEDARRRAVEEILADFIGYFADTKGLSVLLDALKVNEIIRSRYEGYETLNAAQKEAVLQEVTQMILTSFRDDEAGTVYTMATEIMEAILGDLTQKLSDPEFYKAILLQNQDAMDAFRQSIREAGMDVNLVFDAMQELISAAMTEKFGNPSELDGIGSRISTSSISGEGAANVGIAGSAAVTKLQGETLAAFADRTQLLSQDISSGGIVTLLADSAQKVYTTATSSYVANGQPDKYVNKDLGNNSKNKSVGIGASYAMTDGEVSAKALVGTNRRLEALALDQRSKLHNDIDTIAVAGQDPIGAQQKVPQTIPGLGQPPITSNNSTVDSIAADAAAAVTLLVNTSQAVVGEGSVLILTGGNLLKHDWIKTKDQGVPSSNLILRAFQRGQTLTNSSGFAVAEKAAVGASVAVNIVESLAEAILAGSGAVAGHTLVESVASNEDDVNGLAVITGVSLDRVLRRLRKVVDLGNYTDNPPTGRINAKIMNSLNRSSGLALLGNSANSSFPLSVMLMQKLNLQLPGMGASGSMTGALSSSGSGVTTQQTSGQSFNLAAAVGVNMTKHIARAVLNGTYTLGDAKVNAENRGNFLTKGSGATVTLSTGGNNISAGAAAAIHNNQAEALLGGTIQEGSGDVLVLSTLTQNMDGVYPGLLAAQALSGSITGRGGKVGLVGSVAVLMTESQSKAHTLDGTEINGADILLYSIDKSKLAVRADSVQLSGSAVGAGASFALIYAANDLLAGLGKDNVVNARNLLIQSHREEVTHKDYVMPFDRSTLFTVNVPDSDSQRKGLININIDNAYESDSSTGKNSIEVNLSADDLLKVMDLLNYGSMVNYYAEALAGTVVAGSSGKANLAGSLAMLHATGSNRARVGEGSRITLTGDFDMDAKSATATRLIGGSATLGGKFSGGITMAGIVNTRQRKILDQDGNEITQTLQDETIARIGNDVILTSGGSITQDAKSTQKVLAATAAAQISAAAQGAGIGGSISIIDTGSTVKAVVGNNSHLNALQGRVHLLAEARFELLSVAADLAGGGKAAAGGTLSGLVSGNVVKAAIGDNSSAKAYHSISIQAENTEQLIDSLGSLSASSGTTLGATVGVLISGGKTIASVGDYTELTSVTGGICVQALQDAFHSVIMANGAFSGKAAAGATVTVSLLERDVAALVGHDAVLKASHQREGNNILILAQAKDGAYLLTVGGTVAGSGVTLVGNIPVILSQSTVRARVGDYASLTAGDSIVVHSDLDANLVNLAPTAVLSTGNASVGATVSTLVLKNTVKATVGSSASLTAYAANPSGKGGHTFYEGEPNRENRRRGIILKAYANDMIILAAAGLAGGNKDIGGTVVTIVNENKVLARVGADSSLTAGYDTTEAQPEVTAEDAQASVEADSESEEYLIAGKIGISFGSVAAGASVVTAVTAKTVKATVGPGSRILATGHVATRATSDDWNVAAILSFGVTPGTAAVSVAIHPFVYDNKVIASLHGNITAGGDVCVLAKETLELILASASLSGAGTAAVSVAGNALIFQNTVRAELGGTVRAQGNVSVDAQTEILLQNASGSVAGAGTVEVTPVAVVTYFQGISEALILPDSTITAAGRFTIHSKSIETVYADVVGAGGSGTVAVSGAVAINIYTQTTRAQGKRNVSITADTITMDALAQTTIYTRICAIAGAGTVAVPVVAAVTVFHGAVEAGFLGGEAGCNNLTTTSKNLSSATDDGSIRVSARAQRDIQAHVADIGGAGTVAVGVTILAVVSGGKLDQDSADQLANRNPKLDESTGKPLTGGFCPADFLKEALKADAVASYNVGNSLAMDLESRLAGDGVRYSDIQVGSSVTDEKGNVTGQTFNPSQGYVSEEFTQTSPEFNDQGQQGRGENFDFQDSNGKDVTESNADIQAAGSILSAPPAGSRENTISAIIGSGVAMTSAKDIAVQAEELLQAELFNAVIAGSGVVAVPVGLSTAVLFSNVIAGVDAGATLNARGTITVEALSHSIPYAQPDPDSEEGKLLAQRKDLLANQFEAAKKDGKTQQDIDVAAIVKNRTIRVVSIAGGGAGIAGVSVVGSAISLNNLTRAYMNGSVTGSTNLNVVATHDYPHTLAVTGSVAGAGIAGVSASVAVAVTHAVVEAYMDGGDFRNITGAILVQTNADFDTIAADAAIAGAVVGVNAGTVVHVNRMQVNTYVGKDVTMDLPGTLTVEANNTTASNIYFLGVAGGAVGVGVSPAIVVTQPTIHTYIGIAPGSSQLASGAISTGAVTVRSMVTSSAAPLALAGSGGAVSVSGTLILVLNRTEVITGILKKTLDVAKTISVHGNLDATGEASFLNVSGGAVSVGVGVAYALMDAHNEAIVDMTGASLAAGSLSVKAEGNSNAVAEGVGASAGAVAVNVSTAIADNRTRNLAAITGTSQDSVRIAGVVDDRNQLLADGKLSVEAAGTAQVHATLISVTGGALNVGISPVVALLRNIHHARVENISITADSVSVSSSLNENIADSAIAKLDTGSCGIISVNPNVAVAYGRSDVLASLKPSAMIVTGSVDVVTGGKAGTLAQIFNTSNSVVVGGTIATGFAYAQSGFRSELVIPQQQTFQTGSVNVRAEEIQITAVSDVTPNSLGNITIVAVKVNLAVAMAQAKVSAQILGSGILSSSGNVTVSVDSDSYTKATLRSPVLDVAYLNLAANVAVALQKTSQIASIGSSGNLVTVKTPTGTVSVLAKLNPEAGTGELKYGALATAEGSSKYQLKDSKDNWLKLSFFQADAHVMIARTAAENKAEVWGNVESYGLTVEAQSNALAYAQPGATLGTVNLAGLGINVVIADAGGTFHAVIHSPGAITVGLGGITICNIYSAEATALGGQPSFGVSFELSGVSVKTNVAQADTTVQAKASILGSGTVATTGLLTITADGTAKANARIGGNDITVGTEAAVVKVAVNVVEATVGGSQTASIEAGTIYANSGIQIYSNFNHHPTGYTGYDAQASVGSNSGKHVSVAFVDVTTSIADAKVKATVIAQVSGAAIGSKERPAGAVLVYTQAQALAKADVLVGDSVKSLNVTVLETRADAAGTFLTLVGSRMDSDGGLRPSSGAIHAASADVQVISTLRSYARTGTSGSVDTSVVEVKYNEAKAETGNLSQSVFGGSGRIQGAVVVKTTATAEAKADTVHPKVTLGGFNLAVNRTQTNLNAVVSALVDSTGEMEVGGLLTVCAKLDGDSLADVGGVIVGTDKDKQLEIAGLLADSNEVLSVSQSRILAAITSSNGKGSLKAGTIDLDAVADTTATATTSEGIQISILCFGDLKAEAYSTDQVQAYVEKADVTAANLNIDARADTEATASASAVASVNAIEIETSTAHAGIGRKKNNTITYQQVKAGIGDDAVILLTGDLTILAENKGMAKAQIDAGTKINLAQAIVVEIPTVSYYDTQAYIGTNSSVRAGGDVSVETSDDTGADSQARSETFTFAVSALKAKGDNAIYAKNQVKIGASSLFATGDLRIKAFSKADMKAVTTNNNGGGFVNKAVMLAQNLLSRTTTVDIGDGASLESDFGTIEILAQSGTEDSIVTLAEAYGEFSGAGFDKAKVVTTLDSTAQVTIGRAAITNPFGTVHIWSDGSLTGYETNAKASAKGIGAEPDAKGENNINLTSQVIIDGGKANGAELTARNLEIHSRTTQMEVEAKTESVGKAAGLNVDANTQVDVIFTTGTSVANALLRGYDKVNITTSSSPDYDSRNIYAYAKMHLGGIGHGVAEADLDITHYYTTDLLSGVTIYAAQANIQSSSYDGGGQVHQNSSGAFEQEDKGDVTRYFQGDEEHPVGTRVNSGTRFYIGDAAAGIRIDVYEKHGATQIRQVGIKDEKKIWTISGSTILFQNIANNKPGYLTMDVTQGHYANIYDQKFLPHVLITNCTDMDLSFASITVENDNYLSPRVALGGKASYGTVAVTHDPVVTVTSLSTGNVHVGGLIANPRGSVGFYWTGPEGGSLTGVNTVTNASGSDPQGNNQVAPLWANQLEVQGANNVGTADIPINAWLTNPPKVMVRMARRSPSADLITPVIHAAGDVYLRLTPVVYQIIAQQLWDQYVAAGNQFPTDSLTDPLVEVSQITAGGQLHLILEQSSRVYQKENTKTIAMPVPGTLEYITEAQPALNSSVTIPDLTALEHYLESFDLATGVSIYLLPNGTRLYTDRQGEIFRIMESGIDFGLKDYQYNLSDNTVTLGQGVKFNLKNGALSVEDGYSFEALLSVVSGDWLKEQINTGTYRFLYTVPGKDYERNPDNTIKYEKDEQGNVISSQGEALKLGQLVWWYMDGTTTYYYLREAGDTSPVTPQSLAAGAVGQVYILSYDSAGTGTIKAYLMENDVPPTTYEDTVYQYFKPFSMEGYWYGYNDHDKATIEITGPDGAKLKYHYRTFDNVIHYMVDWTESNRVGNSATTKVKDPVWKNTAVSFSGFMGTNYTVKYDVLENAFYLGNEKLTGIQKTGNVYYVKADATSTNDTVNRFYNAARNSHQYWNLSVQNTDNPLNDLDYTYWIGRYSTNTDGDKVRYYSDVFRTLQAKSVTVSSATLREIDLVISPKSIDFVTSGGTTTATTHTHEILFLDPGSNGGNVVITGQISDIPIKPTSLPANDLNITADNAYRITDTLYIKRTAGQYNEENGLAILFRQLEDKSTFVATYNSRTGKYVSETLEATNLKRRAADVIYMPTITLVGGQNVWLEAIANTPDGKTSFAKDIAGRYWIQENGGQWKQTSASEKMEYHRNDIFIDKGQNTKLNNVNVLTTTVGTGDQQILIQENQIRVNVITETDQGILTVRTVGGQKEYYLFSGGIWTHLQESAAQELVTDPDTGAWSLTPSDTTLYMTASVYITLKGKIADPDDDMTIGSDGSVEMGSGAQKQITQFSLPVDGTIYMMGDVSGESVIVEFTDPSASLRDHNGDGANITATNGDVVFFTNYPVGTKEPTGSIGTAEDKLELVIFNGELRFQNGQTLDDRLVIDAYLNVNGNFFLGDDLIIDGLGQLGNTTLILETTDSAITLDNIQVIRNGYVDLNSGAGILVRGNMDVDGSTVRMKAAKDLLVQTISAAGSTFRAEAGEDLTFRIVEARDSDLTLRAKGLLDASDADGYIRFRDTDPKVDNIFTMGGGNIGMVQQPLMVDSDDILYITKVIDYHLDAVELSGEALYAGKRPLPGPQGSGLDRDGNFWIGDWLADAGSGTYYGPMKQQLNGEIAQLLVQRNDRQTSADLITQEALALLLERGSITAESLKQQLLDDDGKPVISPGEIDAMLRRGLESLNGKTGFQELAQHLKTRLTGTTVTDDILIRYLSLSMDENQVDLVRVAQLLEQNVTDEEIDDMIDRAWSTIDYDALEGSGYVDTKPRPITIQVGLAHGTANVTSEGDITIRQDSGTLTAGVIRSDRGDVTLNSAGGSIQGSTGQTNVTGSRIDLTAAGGVGDETRLTVDQLANIPVILATLTSPKNREEVNIDRFNGLWALETFYDFDWVRVEYWNKATQLNITSGGSIHIAEQQGDLGLGVIAAAGDVNLTAPGSILDARDQGAAPNITSGGQASLKAEQGSIGTTDKRLEVQVSDLTTYSNLDTCLNAIGDTNLVADTVQGLLYTDGTGNLTIRNTSGDMALGAIEAAGNVAITSEGGLLLGDRLGRDAQIKGSSISVTAKNGSAGTPEATLTIDTQKGLLNADVTGGTIHITEVAGDLTIGAIRSGGTEDVKLVTRDGSILDGSKDLIAHAAQQEQLALQAQTRVEALEDQQKVLAEYLSILVDTRKQLQQVKDAEEQARQALETLRNDPNANPRDVSAQEEILRKALEDARKAMEHAKQNTNGALDQAGDLEEALNALSKEDTVRQEEWNQLNDRLTQAKQEAQEARNLADEARKQAAASGIHASGDVTLELNASGGTASAGEQGNALGITSDGVVTILPGTGTKLENIILESGGQMTLAPLEAEDRVSITASGHITGTADQEITDITASAVELHSLSGDVGSQTNPMNLSTDTLQASGENLYLTNDRSVDVDLSAPGTVELDAQGNVTGSVIGGPVELNAQGSIDIRTEADSIRASGENVTIVSQGDIIVDRIAAREDVILTAGGRVSDLGEEDAILSKNLTIDAGAIGEQGNPLNIRVPGAVDVDSRYGIVYLRNSWSEEEGNRNPFRFRTLIHEPTGIQVSGYISAEAYLMVTDQPEHEDCAVCRYLMNLEASRLLGRYNIRIAGRYFGTLTVRIPVDTRYNGQKITVAYCCQGTLMAMHLLVEDGYVTFATDRLHTYYLLDGIYPVEDGIRLVPA